MPVVAVGGPTASGKTAFSVQLAKRLGGEVVCADSMQIYKGLDVGTAKATREEMQGVPHHLMDFLPPEETFSVADLWKRRTGKCRPSAPGAGCPSWWAAPAFTLKAF